MSVWMRGICLFVVVNSLMFGMVRDGGSANSEEDDVFWTSVSGCRNAAEVELYLELFPSGRYVEEARACLEKIDTTANNPSPQAIRKAQALLDALGYRPGPVDGIWGRRTAEAYRAFLRDIGLQVDAELTSEVLSRMQTAVENLERNIIGTEFRECDSCPLMVWVPPGAFMMGSSMAEQYRMDDEGPIHEVTISHIFAVGKFEVTQGQFKEFVDATGYQTPTGCWSFDRNESDWVNHEQVSWREPGFDQRQDHPVVCVSWHDAREYVNWVSRITGEQYRLLSESEWEYVARAGTTGPYHFGSTISTDQANYDGDYTYGAGYVGIYRKKTVPVGSFPGNEFGVHDVHGNVWEWVEDCDHENYDGAPSDDSAWISNSNCAHRVLRGGSWNDEPWYLRSANRGWFKTESRNISSGFRVARSFTP